MPSKDRVETQQTDNCFGCGPANPIGLRLSFRTEDNAVKAEFTPTTPYEGYPGYLHGGIVCAILDEAMGWAAYGLLPGTLAVTAKAEIKFRCPLLVGEPLTVTASITRKSTSHLWTEATIRRGDGRIAAEATAIMVIRDSV